ncbi:MurR/RpiR family transcriptional regulator [Saccharopolyspora pogona]|uniref:MurR/RpiR family transcriptional regulator n=1 Tax=Saccharopolyspora pogona TaxID=333966 RepID=UPI0016871C52|nr:MurR/RpiR family transcriptional regulator [Saccharopolyspora pogona]
MNNGADSLPERVRVRYDQLSKSQRKIARFCISHAAEAGSLTAMRIAEKLGVSESTVVRFAIKIGYDGFPRMQDALREELRGAPTPSGEHTERDTHDVALESLRNDLDALQQSIDEIDLSALTRATTALGQATNVFVCGFRTSFSLAYQAYFHLRKVRPSVRLLGDIGGTLVDDLEMIEPGDAVLAFTFPVYDDRTIQVANRAVSVGASCVVVTDSALAPLPIDPLLHPLMVRHDSLSFFNSTVAATALLNSIIVRLAEARSRQEPSFERTLSKSFHIKGNL